MLQKGLINIYVGEVVFFSNFPLVLRNNNNNNNDDINSSNLVLLKRAKKN